MKVTTMLRMESFHLTKTICYISARATLQIWILHNSHLINDMVLIIKLSLTNIIAYNFTK